MIPTTNAFRDGMAALRAGQRQQAEQLLRQATQDEPGNEMTWLWLSGAVTTIEERRLCLERVLSINPNNAAAQRGLAELGPPQLAHPLPAPEPRAAPVQSDPAPEPLAALRPQSPPAAVAAPLVARPRRRGRRTLVGVLSVLAILLISGASARYFLGPDPSRWVAILTDPAVRCSFQSQEYLAALEPVITEWDDAHKLANQTGRMALSGPVAKMQEIRRDASALDAPACAVPVKEAGAAYMDAVIDSYMKFMAQQGDVTVNAAFANAQTKQGVFTKELVALRLDWTLR